MGGVLIVPGAAAAGDGFVVGGYWGDGVVSLVLVWCHGGGCYRYRWCVCGWVRVVRDMQARVEIGPGVDKFK